MTFVFFIAICRRNKNVYKRKMTTNVSFRTYHLKII